MLTGRAATYMSEGIRRGQGFDELAEAFAALSVQCDEWADRWA